MKIYQGFMVKIFLNGKNMKLLITESQYKILVNKPRDVVFGNVNEVENSIPDYSPEILEKSPQTIHQEMNLKLKIEIFILPLID